MKYFKINLFFVFFLLISLNVNAQQRTAVTFQQQVQAQKSAQTPTAAITQPSFRIIAAGEYANGHFDNFNEIRARNLWNGTTASGGSFNNLTGFNVGVGFNLGPGFLGLEFNRNSQRLPVTIITGSAIAVQDTIDIETIQLAYDWVWQNSLEHSYELGLSAGTATKFRYGQLITSTGAGGYNESVYWEDNPYIVRLRGAYNYHFSQDVRFRFALAYENAISDNLKADANHVTTYNGTPITSGRRLTNSLNQPITIDMSGVRVDLGLVIGL